MVLNFINMKPGSSSALIYKQNQGGVILPDYTFGGLGFMNQTVPEGLYPSKFVWSKGCIVKSFRFRTARFYKGGYTTIVCLTLESTQRRQDDCVEYKSGDIEYLLTYTPRQKTWVFPAVGTTDA